MLTGAKGDTGTANVIYSAWNTATNFRDTTIDGSNVQIATLAAPSLTSGDLDSATLMVNFTFGDVFYSFYRVDHYYAVYGG